MKILIICCVGSLLTTLIATSQDIYISNVQYGLTNPSGDYSKVLKTGKDIEITLIRPDEEYTGVGLGFQYAELPYKSNEYKDPYRILFSNLYATLGSFDAQSKLVYGGLIGLGLRFSFASERKTSNDYTYNANNLILETGYWFGLELGGMVGYRITEVFGFSIKAQYDVLTKFVTSSKYLSLKGGLMITII